MINNKVSKCQFWWKQSFYLGARSIVQKFYWWKKQVFNNIRRKKTKICKQLSQLINVNYVCIINCKWLKTYESTRGAARKKCIKEKIEPYGWWLRILWIIWQPMVFAIIIYNDNNKETSKISVIINSYI